MNPENKSTEQNSAPQSTSPGSASVDHGLVMGILSYLGILVIIPLIVAKNDPFVKFHVKQGLVIFCLELIVWILASFTWQLWMIWNLIDLAALVFSVIGIVNVVHKKQKELPWIGGLAKYFTF